MSLGTDLMALRAEFERLQPPADQIDVVNGRVP